MALIVASREAGDKAGAKPIARSHLVRRRRRRAAHHGIWPGAGGKKALERAGLTFKDMDVIEINEAFAAQVLACVKGLGARLQGQPRQSERRRHRHRSSARRSGGRIALTAARQLQRTGGRYALVSMCIGVGQGIAMVIERA